MVRQPLMWAGALDVAEVFRANAEDSEPVKAHRALLWALSTIFGGRWFKAREVVTAVTTSDARDTLREALESLRVKDVGSTKSVGHVLKTSRERVANVDGRELKIETGDDSHAKMTTYRIALAGFAGS